ncbi:MAG TPA: GNAT family N-acetyltransferase [Actinomycetota bacterium]
MAPTIREAAPRDARSLAEIHVRSWQVAYRGKLTDDYLDGLLPEDREERWREVLASPPEAWRTWVAEAEGSVIGFATTGRSEDADADRRTGEVYAIYLDPEAVGTGIGRELFAHAVEDLRERGFHTATLWVLETNTSARRFYETAGWRTDGATTSQRIDCESRPTIRYRAVLA